ncbi:site-specific integrase [Cereibacter sphaeroides]|uniref:tyrosine-type recombinase/integrase n=1 Tax=Cereibacter sphaeroides TaxID=1063 RepID=UPI000F52AAFA|nr:site-specific integrase [Cereibacter sphaeroides]AZB63901.1 site-specific integrase [Cereibacter sphaeroides]AZB68176.1 site-specific integrase [Cereibacter sphaeroides]
MPFRTAKTKVWQYDFQIRGRRFRGSCGTEDYEKAKAVEAAERVRAESAPSMRGEFTLSEAIGTYIADVAQGQPSERVTISQGRMILSVMPGSMLISALTQAEIGRFVTKRKKTSAAGTINRQLQMLGRALQHMRTTHGAKVGDVDLRAAELREPKERVRELSRTEQDRLFQHLRADLHPWVKFALMTGARLATICDLRWSDVHLEEGQMLFRLKGGGTMYFPISREMRAFLTSLPRAEQEPDSAFVITYLSRKSVPPRRVRMTASGGGIAEEFRAALEAAGIPDFRFHDLRHTFATRMLRRTGNLKLVSRLLGHSNIQTTSRYGHVLNEDMADAMGGFSALEFAEFQTDPQSKRNRR